MALTQITEKGIKDGEIINADINASAAIAKSKIETFVTNNADNRVITGSGTANTLNGESNLTYDGSNFQFNTTANGNAVKLVATGNHYNKLSFDSNASSAGGSLAFIDFSWDGDKVADIIAVAGSDTTNKDDGHLSFRTSPSQGSIAERMRIDSSGNVGIGVTPTMAAGGGLHVRGPSGHQARLHMTTSNSGDTGNDGFYIIQQGAESTSNDTNFINYETANMKFSTSGSERMRIDSSGNLGVGSSTTNRGSHTRAVTVSNTSSAARTAVEIEGNTANCHSALEFYNNGTLVSGLNSRGSDRLQFVTGSSGTVKGQFDSDGLKFGSDTAAANALDDYEEGTWTPDPHDGTVSFDNAKYTKVGNVVNCWAYLNTFSDTSTNDQIKIGGLPFVPTNNHVAGEGMHRYSDEPTATFAYVTTSSQIVFYGGSTGGYTQYRHNEINNSGAQIHVHVTYHTNA